MTEHQHPSDELLQRLVQDELPFDEARQLEDHFTTCHHCQSRLVTTADQQWLDSYRDCLTTDVLSKSTAVHQAAHPTDPLDGSRSTGPGSLPNTIASELERESIHRLLDRTLDPPRHPETLGRLGRYAIECVIGTGGMGLVLRAYDHELQRPVAIKMMLPRLAHNGTAKQRFAREARAVAAILHPNVIAIHEIDETRGMPWFAMPLIAGPSLRQLVDRTGPLPEREIARIGLQIASGLSAAHGQGLVHRDIKPENILVDNHINRVVVTDFGLASRETETSITQTGVLAGTLNYMSPEQVRGEVLDARSDLFSLGGLLYFLATGEAPFQSDSPLGTMHLVATGRQVNAQARNPEISRTLAQAIDTLLAKDAARRFRSAADVEKFFEELVAHWNQPTRHRLPAVPRFRQVPGWITAAAVLGLGLVVAVGSWWYSQQAAPEDRPIEQMWADIQLKYGLSPEDAFPTELQRLAAEIDQLDDALLQPDVRQLPEDPSHAEAVWELDGEIQRLEQLLGEPVAG